MTSISIEALKGKTIKQIRELIRQAESLPENQSPSAKKRHPKGEDTPEGTKPQSVQDIIDELKEEKK